METGNRIIAEGLVLVSVLSIMYWSTVIFFDGG